MFDFAWSEFALIGVVALVVIGPKDMPTALRAVAKGVRKARKLAGEFQTHVDDMVREADLGEIREHVRDLRSMDVRGRIMRAIDDDGTLRRGLTAPSSLSSVTGAASGMGAGTSVDTAPGTTIGTPLEGAPGVTPAGVYPYSSRQEATEIGMRSYGIPEYEPEEIADAPSIVPPAIARRILRERPKLNTPSILPPVRMIHHNRRVAAFLPPERH